MKKSDFRFHKKDDEYEDYWFYVDGETRDELTDRHIKPQNIKRYISSFRNMSFVELIESHFGIKLLSYQKIMLYIFDMKLKFEKRYIPYRYYQRVMRML